jgi:hypothetical protein
MWLKMLSQSNAQWRIKINLKQYDVAKLAMDKVELPT